MNASTSFITCAAGALALSLTAGAMGYARYASFAQLSPQERAERLLELHARFCDLARLDVAEGLLEVECSDGSRVRFVAQEPCAESFACEMLGVDAACWQRF